MEIKDLNANNKVPEIVVLVDNAEEVTKTPNGIDVQSFIVSDKSGQCRLVLWREDTGKFSNGDKLLIKNGYCKSFQDNLEITTGKFGKVMKVPEKPQ